MKTLIIFACLLSLMGCTATTTGSKPTTTVSGFDNSKTVSIAPHGVACSSMSCVSIGATWISKFPEDVGLSIFLINNFASIQRVEFNIDGEMIQLNSKTITNFEIPKHSLTGTSEKTFVTDYSIIKKIINSKKAWVRVYTSKGLIEDAILDQNKDSKAFHALKRFDEEVGISK